MIDPPSLNTLFAGQRWQDQPWRYEGGEMDCVELDAYDRARVGITR